MTDEKSPGDALRQSEAPKKDVPPAAASSNTPVTEAAKPLSAEHQWHLALAHLAMSDRAANVRRGLLFAAAAVLLAFTISALQPGMKGPPLWTHGLSLFFCAVAIGSLMKSFRLQSEQSHERFRLIKDGNLEGFAQYDAVIEQLRGRQSGFWDRIAFWSLALAFAIQALAKVLTTGVVLHV